MQKKDRERIAVAVLASLTLGLAPFVPEPHLVGKIKWVLGGAEGMKGMDWFDLALHGAPWVYLLVVVGLALRNAGKGKRGSEAVGGNSTATGTKAED